MKFMVGYRRGEYKAEDIDECIDAWHCSSSEESLPSHLGMTFEEYTAWVEKNKTLDELRDTSSTLPPPPPSLLMRFLIWLVRKLLPEA